MSFRNRKNTIHTEEDLFVQINNIPQRRKPKKRPTRKYIEERNYTLELMNRDEDCLGDLSPTKKERVRKAGFKKNKDS